MPVDDLKNPNDVLLDRYGVEITLIPGDVRWHPRSVGELTFHKLERRSLQDLPNLIFMTWQSIPTLKDAVEAAEVMRDWWAERVKWTPLSRPKDGDPSLLSRQALVAPTSR